MEKFNTAGIEELINSKFLINEEQHKNILSRVDLSISVHKEILKQHEDFLKSIQEEVKDIQTCQKAHTIDISKAKGAASLVGILAAIATIIGSLALFFR